MSRKIYQTKKKKVICTRRGDVLIKKVKDEHLYRKLNAWCTDVLVIEQAIKDGVKVIKLENQDTGTVLVSSMKDLKKHAQIIDEGWGKQYALEEKYWMIIPSQKKPEEARPEIEQLSLFGGE